MEYVSVLSLHVSVHRAGLPALPKQSFLTWWDQRFLLLVTEKQHTVMSLCIQKPFISVMFDATSAQETDQGHMLLYCTCVSPVCGTFSSGEGGGHTRSSLPLD